MIAHAEQMTKQLTNAWSPARWSTLVTFGHLVNCLFNTTYRAKYYLTNAWSPAWSSDPSNGRLPTLTGADGHMATVTWRWSSERR